MATTDRSTVVGVFPTRALAEQAIEELHHAGFHDNQIGFIARNGELLSTSTGTESVVGATTRAVGGGVLGGLLGAAAALLIPGLGPAVAGGILSAVLGGATLGAVAGGFIGALTSMGITEEEARYYQLELTHGGVLVVVKDVDRYAEALDILHRRGAYDTTTRPEASPSDTLPETSTSEVGTEAYVRDPEDRRSYDSNIPYGTQT
jgi:hypothetical protein